MFVHCSTVAARTSPCAARTIQPPSRRADSAGLPVCRTTPAASAARASPRVYASGFRWPPVGSNSAPWNRTLPIRRRASAASSQTHADPAPCHARALAATRGARAAACAGFSQPVWAASHAMPKRRISANVASAEPATMRASRPPRSAPSFAASVSGPMRGRLGTTKPPLRPDAPAPIASASRTTTRTPASASASAADKPRMPAPMIATSHVASPVSGEVSGGGGAVSSQSGRPAAGSVTGSSRGSRPPQRSSSFP